MCSSHNSSTTRMATATTKKTRHLLKKEIMFTLHRLQKKPWFGRNGSVRREGGGSSGIACSVLSREVSAVSVYMLRQGLRRKTSVWLTRTLSYCLLVLQPPPGSVTPNKLDPCLQPSVVLPSSKEHSGWPSGALALWEDGLGMLACQDLARSIHRVAHKKQTF